MLDDYTQMPFSEYRFGEKGLGAMIEELSSVDHPNLALVECAYQMGYYPEAIEAADVVITDNPDTPDAMIARCLKFYSHLTLGDGEEAHKCMEEALAACRALYRSESENEHFSGIIGARIIEDCSLISIDEAKERIEHIEDLQSGARSYCGFQMAYRAYLCGDNGEAIGIARSFLAMAGHRYPVSCVKLHLVAAGSYLRLGDAANAVAEFREAWNLAHPLGIVAPFVELSACMPGLTRHELHDSDESSFVLLRTLIMRYRKGWHELRNLCQKPIAGETLSILEYTAATMAIWGWSNRETAVFLGLSENTVKHYLRNVYQKLEVKSRRQLIDALINDEVCGKPARVDMTLDKASGVHGNRLHSTI